MKDVNLFTVTMFGIGLYTLLDHASHIQEHQWSAFLLITLLIILLDLFPIKMPSGTVYSSGIIGFMYLLFVYGFSTCLFAVIVSTAATFLKDAGGRLVRLKGYRFFVTLGIYFVSALGSLGVIDLLHDAPVVLRVFLALTAFEVVNALMLAIVRWSVGGPFLFGFFTKLRELIIPVLIFTVVLTRFLLMHGFQALVLETVYTLFFLSVIFIFSNQYQRIADARRESEEKYRLIADNTLDLIVVMDSEGMITYTSPSHSAKLGMTPSTYENRHLYAFVHPEDIPVLRSSLRAMKTTLAPFQQEFRLRDGSGDWVVVEAHAAPVAGHDGLLERIVVVARDVRERRATEELLRKSDKLAVVGQLAAGVAHEIRNPLTALKGFVQLLRPKVTDRVDYINIMLAELSRIELIIGEFLILAKPQVVQFQAKRGDDLLRNVIALLETQAIINNVQFETRFAQEVPDIQCEENQLKQVFINILKNSIEAMQSGGRILIELFRADSENVIVRFTDEGPGIPEENLNRLGEPFYTTKETGTGLGLMVSYRIIQAHRGAMRITSEIGHGTSVEITLPSVATSLATGS